MLSLTKCYPGKAECFYTIDKLSSLAIDCCETIGNPQDVTKSLAHNWLVDKPQLQKEKGGTGFFTQTLGTIKKSLFTHFTCVWNCCTVFENCSLFDLIRPLCSSDPLLGRVPPLHPSDQIRIFFVVAYFPNFPKYTVCTQSVGRTTSTSSHMAVWPRFFASDKL